MRHEETDMHVSVIGYHFIPNSCKCKQDDGEVNHCAYQARCRVYKLDRNRNMCFLNVQAPLQ